MTPEQFIYWLQGYTAATTDDVHLATIKERLAEVELGRVFKPSDRAVVPVTLPVGAPTLDPNRVPYAHEVKRCTVGGIVKSGPDHWIQNIPPGATVKGATLTSGGLYPELSYDDIKPLAAEHDGTDWHPGVVKAMDPIATVDRCDTSKFFMRGADAEDDDFEGAPV